MNDLSRYEEFRRLHRPGTPLVLVNAWDVGSARLIAAAGAPAVATTSAGVAWGHGYSDGDVLTRDLALESISRIVAALDIPVTADIESGFAGSPDGVADTVRAVRAAGAVGVNIEDGVRPIAEMCERLRAVDATGVFVNARVDTYLRGDGDIRDAIARAHAYVDCGVGGVFVPGVGDAASIRTLVDEIPAPLNVLVGPGSPPVAALTDLGVARISLGSSVAQAAYAVALHTAREAYEHGTYGVTAGGLDYGALNSRMRRDGP